MKFKKADFEFESIIKLLIVLIALFIIIGLIFMFKKSSSASVTKVFDLLRFGR
ncbi:hypothetical protein J4476_00220 [Candidatus Woesearchaeota archaeon]|nr:hypothetical protein [Candidatus Woesearchaeota archaeon]HIH25519.1 hypothetical protein [Nanoarchaeota archaeon]